MASTIEQAKANAARGHVAPARDQWRIHAALAAELAAGKMTRDEANAADRKLCPFIQAMAF